MTYQLILPTGATQTVPNRRQLFDRLAAMTEAERQATAVACERRGAVERGDKVFTSLRVMYVSEGIGSGI